MNETYVYLFDDMGSLNDCFITDNLGRLPKLRQEQCVCYRQDADKINCILAYLLLEQGLREQYGITAPVSFAYNKHSKPYLQEHPNIFFSISHCKKGVICGLSEVEIGIDIQDVRSLDLDVARRVCSKNELRELERSDDPARLFCRMWTKKESYIKMRGISISNDLKQDKPDTDFIHWETIDYCIALFAERKLYVSRRRGNSNEQQSS